MTTADAGDGRGGEDYFAGDFAAFFTAQYGRVTALALALTGSSSLAEDIAQEAFVATFRKWERVRGYDRPDAFVRRVAVNLSVSAGRRRAREAAALKILFHRTPPTDHPQSDDAFWDAVRSLPRRQRQAVALYYLEDRSIADIATVLRLSEGAVKAHLHKARQSLASRLAVSFPEETP